MEAMACDRSWGKALEIWLHYHLNPTQIQFDEVKAIEWKPFTMVEVKSSATKSVVPLCSLTLPLL